MNKYENMGEKLSIEDTIKDSIENTIKDTIKDTIEDSMEEKEKALNENGDLRRNEKAPQREEFTCKRDGLTIKGVRYLCPSVDGGKVPAVIASHGFTDNYTGMEVYCEALCREGYAAFCFSFCGGGSIGEPAEVHSDGDSRDMSILSEVGDLCAVIEYVRSLDYIDGERITLLGASQGGFVSGLAAAHYQMNDQNCRGGDDRGQVTASTEKKSCIENLIMLYPALCIPDHARRGCLGGASYDVQNVPEEIKCGRTVLGRQFHEEVYGMDPFLELAGYKGPVLIIHGSRDGVVDYSYSIRARDSYEREHCARARCALQIFRDMGHGSDRAQTDSIIASIRQFLAGRREIFSFQIVITHADVTTKGNENHCDIYFTGYCDSPHFKGAIVPEGVDHRVSGEGLTESVRAEYAFDGTDGDGNRCRLQVVNQWGGRDWKPVITTDSGKLAWLNGADLTAVLEGQRGGLTVRVFAEGETAGAEPAE